MAELGMTVLRILGLVVFDVVLLAGLLAIPIGLGGNFIILGAALVVALVTRFVSIPWYALVILAVCVIIGEVVEALLGSLMARRYGASGWGMTGAFVGGLAGAAAGTAILPVIGTLIGSFLGTALGALVVERISGAGEAEGTRAGFGAFLGKTLASALKFAIGAGAVIYLIKVTH